MGIEKVQNTHTRAHECEGKIPYECEDKRMRAYREVGGWGRDPKKCTGRDWGMGSSTI